MLYDTVEALLAVRDVQRVLVICGRSEDVFELQAWPGVETILEAGLGLNDAIRLGELTARATDPSARLAVCPADLPALHPGELARVLISCTAYERCVVADSDGSGTTLLTASSTSGLLPEFGPESLVAHVRSGAQLLDLPSQSSLRSDVDYVTDLDGLQQRAPRSRTAQLMTRAQYAGSDV
jgi:2-phospho-L-lactate guanylyltransferase